MYYADNVNTGSPFAVFVSFSDTPTIAVLEVVEFTNIATTGSIVTSTSSNGTFTTSPTTPSTATITVTFTSSVIVGQIIYMGVILNGLVVFSNGTGAGALSLLDTINPNEAANGTANAYAVATTSGTSYNIQVTATGITTGDYSAFAVVIDEPFMANKPNNASLNIESI